MNLYGMKISKMAGKSFSVAWIAGQNLQHSLSWKSFQCLQVLSWNYVNQKVKYFSVINTCIHVTFLTLRNRYLQGSSLWFQSKSPCPVCKLYNEHFTGFGKENRCFRRDHLRVNRNLLWHLNRFSWFFWFLPKEVDGFWRDWYPLAFNEFPF